MTDQPTVPGEFRCPDCGFVLIKSIINPASGAVGRDAVDRLEPCPNDGTILRPVSYAEALAEARDEACKAMAMVRSTGLRTVYTKGRSVGVGEKCVPHAKGGYVGVDTYTHYPAESHYHRPQYAAEVVNINAEDRTGMAHLEGDGLAKKAKLLGAKTLVEEAHMWGVNKVYYSTELGEYFSQSELLIGERVS